MSITFVTRVGLLIKRIFRFRSCLVLCFRFDALTEFGAFMRTEVLCMSVLRVASGPQGEVG